MTTAQTIQDVQDTPPRSNAMDRLTELEAKVNKLERQAEGPLDTWQKRGSFMALLIGIVLSGYSLFETFYAKPKDAALHDIEEFNHAVNEVANLRQGLIRTQLESKNPQLTMAMSSMTMPQILANIQYATALLPKLGDDVGVPQLIVLIGEAMNIYDWRSAELLVDRAIHSPKAIPTMRSEAYRYKARLNFMTGKAQEGRKAFEDSLNAIREEPGFGINGARAYIVSDWVISEFNLGDCSIGNERVTQFLRLLDDPQVQQMAKEGMRATLKAQLMQSSHCPMPSEL